MSSLVCANFYSCSILFSETIWSDRSMQLKCSAARTVFFHGYLFRFSRTLDMINECNVDG